MALKKKKHYIFSEQINNFSPLPHSEQMWVILKECPNLGIEMKMTTYWYALCPRIPHNIHFPYMYVVNFHHKDYHLKSHC